MWRWAIRAVLVLILLALVIMRFRPKQPSYGLPVRLVTTDYERSEENIVEGRMIRLLVDNGGRTFINTEYCPLDLLHSRLSAIYSTRNQRVLYIDADDSMPFQTVIDVMNHGQSALESISVVLITPSVRKQCEWRWAPIHDYLPD
jgi:biopolymer transport protein ExbD